MSTRLIRILFALIIVGIISALFLLNPQETVVFLGKGEEYRAPMALVLILTFVAGAVMAAVLAFVAQFRLSLLNWQERRLRKLQREHLKDLVTVREQIALQKWDEAKRTLSKILKEDADNAVARTLLAIAVEALEGGRAALRVLEEGRGRELVSAELYLKAAELQEREGNLTAALDNLNLLLQRDPNARMVLREAVRVSAELGDLKRAIEYQERLTRIVERTRYVEEQNKLAELELKAALKQDDAGKDEALEQVLRRHRDFPEALKEKAKRSIAKGEFDKGTRELAQAFSAAGDISFLHEIAKFWLSKNEPERAIKAVRGALKERELPQGRAYLAALLASIGMAEQSERELSTLSESNLSPEGEVLVRVTRARLLQGKGESVEAIKSLAVAVQKSLKDPLVSELLEAFDSTTLVARRSPSDKTQLSPLYSTP